MESIKAISLHCNCYKYNLVMQEQKIKDVLTSCGISPSGPRTAILSYMREHFTHPTAEDIFRDLKPLVPTLSLTTVYNTLKLFVEKGLCLSITINEKMVRFDGNTMRHGHLLCTRCGTLYDVAPTPDTSDEAAWMLDGHLVSEVHYYYKGTCSKCLSAETHMS